MEKEISFDKIAEILFKKIKIPDKKLRENYFVIFVGIPGSGKTTLARWLSKKYSFCRVSTDRIKNYLRKHNYLFEVKDLFKIQRKIFYKLLEKKVNIVSDSNSDLRKYRDSLKHLSKKFKYTSIIIYLKISIENAYTHLLNKKKIRKSKTLYKKLIRFHKTLEEPKEAIKIYVNNDRRDVLKQVDNEICKIINKSEGKKL